MDDRDLRSSENSHFYVCVVSNFFIILQAQFTLLVRTKGLNQTLVILLKSGIR